MKRLAFLLPRLALLIAALGSVAYAALPVARHAAGVIVLETPAIASAPAAPPAASVDLTPIFERAPFGRAAPAETVAETRTDTPELVLRGIFASTGTAAAALIDVDGTPGLFRHDASVTDTLVLATIAADHVTLRDGNTTLTLRFDEATETEAPDEATPAGAAAPEDLIARLGNGLVVPARYTKPKPPETTSEYIDYWRKRIQKNPAAVLAEIGLEPTDDGYVIADQHDVGVGLAGLKAGDLVRTVNGQTVGNPEDDRRFYDRIAASGQARLEVERDGRILTFSFPLR